MAYREEIQTPRGISAGSRELWCRILAHQGVMFVLGLVSSGLGWTEFWAISSVCSMKVKLNTSLESGQFWSDFPPRTIQLGEC